MARPKPVKIAVGASQVSGLLLAPETPRAGFVLAHGAGAGMTHPFMEGVAQELAERGIATLRYQFAYMEQGGKRPDVPKVAHAAGRADRVDLPPARPEPGEGPGDPDGAGAGGVR
ncbi:MAG: alpha/beta family hydrolase, partial [Micropepsaceae bacterium]